VQLVPRQFLDIDASEQLNRFFDKSETCRHDPSVHEQLLLHKALSR